VRGWTLRTQVAVAAAGSILLGVILLGAALQVLLARDLHEQLDRTLRQRAADVAALGATTPRLLTAPGALDSSATSGTILIQVYDGRGRIYARSQSLGAGLLPASTVARRVIRDGRPRYADARFGSQAIRVYAAPLASLGGAASSGGAVVVASSTQQVNHTLQRLRTLTLLSGLVAALLALPAAMLVTRRVLRPVERLSADAAVIRATGDSSRRVSHPDGPHEIAELAVTVNGMLEALERARDAERRFLADASHELRTPLTALRGNAEYLARHAPDGEAFADLEADIARLARLVDSLLALAREDAATAPAERVDLAEVAAAFAGDTQVMVAVAEPVHVRGDGPAIERAVGNLVANAKRYGPTGAPVEVRVERAGERAVISVTDRGEGIPDGLAGDAATRFWRGPNSSGTEGSGLGLALVQATALRHGGVLEIDGPRFALVLPLLRDSSETAAYTAGVPTEKGR
jgi:two-component system, OmpR family, sensor kinase